MTLDEGTEAASDLTVDEEAIDDAEQPAARSFADLGASALALARRREWAPFPIGAVGALLAILLAEPIGTALGLYDDVTGYFRVVFYAAIPIAFLAAIVSRRWLGVLTLELGFAAAGVCFGLSSNLSAGGDIAIGVVGGALLVALAMGFAGVPVYLGVMLVTWLVTFVLRLTRPRP